MRIKRLSRCCCGMSVGFCSLRGVGDSRKDYQITPSPKPGSGFSAELIPAPPPLQKNIRTEE